MNPASDSVLALVVSYNTRDVTLRCVAALQASRGVRVRVVVADNGSQDGSAASIERCYPEVHVLRCGSNLGFGRANNHAFECEQGSFVLLVNADCFVQPDTIAACLAFLKRTSGASAVACQLRRVDGSIQPSCRRFPSLAGEVARISFPVQLLRRLPHLGSYFMAGWDHDTLRTVDQPAGAFLLIRNGAWGEGPLFDERFFMYFEDVDLCRRLWRRGPIWFLPTVHAVHIGEHSTAQVRVTMASALAESRYKYFAKWHGTRVARSVAIIDAVGGAVRACAWSLGAALGIGYDAKTRAVAHRVGARSSLSKALSRHP